MDKNQIGFVRQMGCEVHIQKILNDLHERKRKHWGSWVALFDLRKAYDSVDHGILLEKL